MVAENYTNINSNIKRFVSAVKIILPKLQGQGRRKRAAAEVDCTSVSNMAGILGMEDGGVREGDMFSYARIKVSFFFNEMLPVVEWMAQQDLTECSKVVDKKYVHMLDVNLQRLQTFLEIKEQSVQHQERIRSAVNSDMRWRSLSIKEKYFTTSLLNKYIKPFMMIIFSVPRSSVFYWRRRTSRSVSASATRRTSWPSTTSSPR